MAVLFKFDTAVLALVAWLSIRWLKARYGHVAAVGDDRTGTNRPTASSDEDEIIHGAEKIPVSVNYHFTRKCNKQCGFCFHTEKSSYVASARYMKEAMRMLKDAGMRKINFAGGEPFLYPEQLAMLCEFCKADLGLESVSIITNGTKVTEHWLQDNHKYVDILGVSCDSFDEDTNVAIGRGTGNNVAQLFKIRDWCAKYNIKFKLNTVVCSLNWHQDMAQMVTELKPFRWKCFQVLLVESENTARELYAQQHRRLRNGRKFLITDEQYQAFCSRHDHVPGFIAESNEVMASSYLILDEYFCFLDKGGPQVKQSPSIMRVGVQKALASINWDRKAFQRRGGIYDWSKGPASTLCDSELPPELEF
ncbi:hypothetical protein MRB53_040485 [Persea americana]|nr:hypothetical protein MRB53_040485 [Persea americana]